MDESDRVEEGRNGNEGEVAGFGTTGDRVCLESALCGRGTRRGNNPRRLLHAHMDGGGSNVEQRGLRLLERSLGGTFPYWARSMHHVLKNVQIASKGRHKSKKEGHFLLRAETRENPKKENFGSRRFFCSGSLITGPL